MSEQNEPITTLTRREFIKVMGTAGVTAAFVSACAPAAIAPAPISAPPAAPLVPAAPVVPVAPAQSAAAQAGDVLASAGKDLVLRTYTRMVRSRRWETSLKDMRMSAQKDPMYGSWYPYVGEEAIANGVCATLNDSDWICISHRSQGGVVAKGVDLQKNADEIFFRTTGTNQAY
ncbi:MAG: pdhA, partial [Bacteroidetes bacterium]|nr:pdhA [Bacteroidota bacterium]